MPLTPKAKYAREIAERVKQGYHDTIRPTVTTLHSLAEEYIALFDDYEDRYRRAKVEALNEVIQELNDYLDGIGDDHGGLVVNGEDRVEDAIELAERVRLRYLKEGGG